MELYKKDGTFDDVCMCVGQLFRRSSLHAEMNTDQDLPLDGQSTMALFTSKGVDVTPNKDQGVVKVFF